MTGENTKNYREQGGERWVVGGVIDIVGNGELLKDGVPVDLTPSGMSPAAAQANSAATDAAGLVADFNALLAKLRAAGLMDT